MARTTTGISAEKLYKTLSKFKGDYIAAATQLKITPNQVAGRFHALAAADQYADKDDLPELLAALRAFQTMNAEQLASHRAKKKNTQLRRQVRSALDNADLLDELIQKIDKLPPIEIPRPKAAIYGNAKKSLEILITDIHLGKATRNYNSKIAQQALERFAGKTLNLINRENPSEVVVVVLGDIIEGTTKHRDSREGCDIGLMDQVVIAFQSIAKYLTTITLHSKNKFKVRVIGCTGNHEHLYPGAAQNKQGRNHLSWIIYHAVQSLCPFVYEFHIEENSYTYYEIQGVGICAEHGNVSTNTEAKMRELKMKRADQMNKIVEGFRQGDRHSAVVCAGGLIACGGTWLRDNDGSEYSSNLGYKTRPEQLAFVWENGKITNTYFIEVT